MRISGGGGSEFLNGELLFRTEPVFLLMTVFSAADLVEFVSSFSDLVFKFELLQLAYPGGNSFGATVRLKNSLVNCLRLVQ